MIEPISFLDGVSGYVRKSTNGAADKGIRLASIDPAYDPFSSPYPAGIPLPRVTFEGEATLSGKTYAVASGYVPAAGARVWMVPIGNTYLIAGAAQHYSTQGFYSEPDGSLHGVEFGGGSFFDTTVGLQLETDADIAGDLSVGGIGKTIDVIKPSNTTRIVNTISADPHLIATLDAGTWWVEFDIIMGGANGDLKTAWAVTGTTATYSLRTCWGPSPFTVDTATALEARGRDSVPMRVGVHQYATEIEYGMASASLYTSAWERGLVRLTTSGTVALSWSQAAVDAPTPSVIVGGSMLRARRVA